MYEFWSIVEVEGKIYPFGFLAKETKEGRFVYHATLIPTPKYVEKLDGIEKKKENDSAASFGLSYKGFARHFPSILEEPLEIINHFFATDWRQFRQAVEDADVSFFKDYEVVSIEEDGKIEKGG